MQKYGITMGFFSGFPTKKQQDRYNHLLKELLTLINQIIITYVEQNKLGPFQQQYYNIFQSLKKLEIHKYTMPKFSEIIEPLNQHMNINFVQKSSPRQKMHSFVRERYSNSFKNERQIKLSQTIHAYSREKIRNRKGQKNISIAFQKFNEYQSLTIEDLLKNQPRIQRKLSFHRKKLYGKNKIPLIKQEDNEQIDNQN